MSNNSYSVVSYLRLTYSNHHFTSAIMKILVEDRKATHAERIKNSRNIVTMHPGDIFIARTTIKSDKATDKVAKLCYTVQGFYQIFRGTVCDSYIVRKLYNPDSPEFKFMSEDLYIFPLSLKLCEPVVSSDTRYINQSYASIVNSFL